MEPGSTDSGPRVFAELLVLIGLSYGWKQLVPGGGRPPEFRGLGQSGQGEEAAQPLPGDMSRVTQQYVTWVLLFAQLLAALSSKRG